MKKLVPIFCGVFAALTASTCLASEGDVLLDIAPSASFFGGGGRDQPSIGGQLGLFWGINDITDLGVFGKVDRGQPKGGGKALYTSMGGISSWLTTYEGVIRPQVGGQIGYAHANSRSFLHLAVQARALIELATHLRLFIGGTAGGLLGSDGTTFASAEIGVQVLFF